jgi:hypothetical protein
MLGGGGWTINLETKVKNPLDLSGLLMASTTKMPKLENLTKEGIKVFKNRYEEYKVQAPMELVRAPQKLLKLEYLEVMGAKAGLTISQVMGLEETDRSRSKNGACGRITLSLRKDCDLIALRFSLVSTNHRSDAATVGSLCRIGEVEN